MYTKADTLGFVEGGSAAFLEISHKIWEYAELSLKEYRSAETYAGALEKEGFSVETNLCGIRTAFSGSYGSGKPVIGILGEFDALSGLSQKAFSTTKEAEVPNGNGHGCGHNMLGAASFGAALGIKKYLEETGTPGTVIFFGCPGEEGGASKALMAREGVWKKLDAALTWHPGDTNEVTAGTCNSCIQTIYRFHGVAAHAAGDPENGRSALDAVELLNVGVQFLREHMPQDARIHYSILNAGGISPNVVQPEAEVLYMIRSPKVKDTIALEKRTDDIAKGAALMTGTEMEKIFVDGCAGTFPNAVLGRLLYDNMLMLGAPQYTDEELEFAAELRKTYTAPDLIPGTGSLHSREYKAEASKLSLGGKKDLNDFILPLYEGEHFSPGSTDVGDVSMLTPTAQFTAVTQPSFCPGHSWQNVSCGASPLGDKGTVYAAKVLCAAAIDLFTDAELLAAAKKEFDENAPEYCCPVPPGAELYVI